jgi:hypothetical protein
MSYLHNHPEDLRYTVDNIIESIDSTIRIHKRATGAVTKLFDD